MELHQNALLEGLLLLFFVLIYCIIKATIISIRDKSDAYEGSCI